MSIGVKGLAASALTLAAFALGGAGVAQAQSGPVLENGRTKAVYDYRAAIRERVFIPQPGVDQDSNGAQDWVTIDIIRPSEGGAANRMPAIIDPSPYYTTVCRGAEGQCMADWDKDGRNDRWPLFYDNYFVPRGYAYVLAQMNGTGYTTNGCPHHGGPGDIAGEKSVDRLAQRPRRGLQRGEHDVGAQARRLAQRLERDDRQVLRRHAGQRRGRDGRRGPEDDRPDLRHFRLVQLLAHGRGAPQHQLPGEPQQHGHHRRRRDDRPPGTVELPERRTLCNPLWTPFSDDADLLNGDGDAHGDINQFWRDRDYVKDAEQGQGRGLRHPRLPGRQRPHGPPRHVVGRAEGQQRPAQAVAAARRA